MIARFFILIVTSLLLSIHFPAVAKEASNNQISVTVQDQVTLKGSCTSLKLSYKILPRYRQTPGWIKFNLRPTQEFDEEVSHSYHFFNYNIDMNSGIWKFNNADFFGNVGLNFCKNDGFDEEAKRTGLKKSGLYYVTAYPVFVTNPSSVKGDSSFLTIPIKVNVISSINCLKGNLTKKVSGSNPKCPKGYKEEPQVKRQVSNYRYNSLNQDPVCFNVSVSGPSGGGKVPIQESSTIYTISIEPNNWCDPKFLKSLPGYSYLGFPTNRWLSNTVVEMLTSTPEICWPINTNKYLSETADRLTFEIKVALKSPGTCWLETAPAEDGETPLLLNGARRSWAIVVTK